MFKGNNNFVVGLFVSVSIAVFVGFVLWLTGRSGVEEMENYSMMFHRDVSGLSIGGPVNFMGVNIGTVTRMQLVRNENMNVRVDIEILETTPVDSGTFASLAFQGITGVAVINLSSDPGLHDPIVHAPGHEFPVIPVRDVGLAALLSSAPKIMDQMDDLLTQANQLLGEQNRAAIARFPLSRKAVKRLPDCRPTWSVHWPESRQRLTACKASSKMPSQACHPSSATSTGPAKTWPA